MRVNNYTVSFMVSLLQNREKVSESRFYKADLNASDFLIDLDNILKKAKLTDKQKFVLEYCYIYGYTQYEVALIMGVTQQMIEKHTRAIKKKIRKILREQEEI